MRVMKSNYLANLKVMKWVHVTISWNAQESGNISKTDSKALQSLNTATIRTLTTARTNLFILSRCLSRNFQFMV
jgi:hypothetical protein